MGVAAHLERTVNLAAGPVVADGLSHRKDMRLGEGAVQRCAAVSAGAKGDHLVRVTDFRPPLIILPFQFYEINEQCLRRRFACER